MIFKSLSIHILAAVLIIGLSPMVRDLSANSLPYGTIDFEHLTTRDGLANPVVYDMIQDRHGFLWFGTGNGISKFNGYEFINYFPDAEDPYSIGKGPILKLFLDSKNNIWATSLSTGLYKFDEKNNRFSFFRHDPEDTNSLPSDTAYKIDEDKFGNLWISTLDAGIVRYNPDTDTYTRFQHDPSNPDSLSSNATAGILCDSQGHIWISTMKNGCDRFDPTTGIFTHYLPGTPHAIDMIEDQFHDIWIPTLGHGVYRFIRNEGRFVSYTHDNKDPNSISHNQVIKAFEDRTGTMWLTTWGGGVNIYDRESDMFKSYMHDPVNPFSISHNSTWGIFEDHSGVIWIGTYGAGVNKFDRKKERFQVTRHYPGRSDGLSHSSVKTIHEDANGIFWIGTLGGGLTKYNPASGKYRHFLHDPTDSNSICHNNVWKIVEDSRQNLWIGTEDGLDRFDKRTGQFLHFKADDGDPDTLSSNLVRSLLIDDQNRLWVGTQLHGVDRLDLSDSVTPSEIQFEHFKVHGGHNSVLFQDSSGGIWVANQNLFRFDQTEKRFKQWIFSSSDQNIAPGGLITAAVEDADHNLWIGTASRLHRLNPRTNQLKQYGPEQGLNDSSIAGLQFYPPNNLWISTSKGLSVMDFSRGIIKNYELGIFNRGATLMAKNGDLFFGSIHGMIHFSPEKIFDNPHIPNVVITSFKKMNMEYDTGTSLTLLNHLKLGYEDRYFSFDFAALDFSDPDKNQYRYRLLGFDDRWIEVDSRRRFAAYTNIDPGSYTFQVQGSNNDGIWNTKGVSVDLVVSPPWWQTRWFYSSLVLVILIIISGTIWYLVRLTFEINQRKRVEQSLRISEEKYRDVVEGTNDLITIVDHNGNLIFVNSMAETIYGLPVDQCIGRSAFEFVHPDDQDMTRQWFDNCIKEQQSNGSIENHQVNSRTGACLTVLWTCHFHYDESGQMISVNSIARDITERKNMEQIIIQSEKMMSIGGLAAGMAHEINNPLAGMMQNAQVAQSRLTRDLKANTQVAEGLGTSLSTIREYMTQRGILKQLEAINKSGQRAAKIVENMLSFAKKGSSEKTTCRLDSLLDKTILLAENDYDLKKKFDFKAVSIIREYDPALPEVYCEPSKIQQVMFNIVKNASQAMSDHTYTTGSPKIILRLKKIPGKVRIEIQDNGPGIEDKICKRIFEPFFTTKGPDQGTGLGLSVSYFIIVNDHHGDMRVESRPGIGTNFIIHLPVS
ncbi:MAG: PAS domain S-box protein [Desulfobacteraceae bacterium]|nr:MAG: PAS domain S-box protein [Desulfobacteraceae bacterium]